MLIDLSSTLTRLDADAQELLDAATPKPSDETSPRGVAEMQSRLRGDAEAIANAVKAAEALLDSLHSLAEIAATPAPKGKRGK